MHLARFHCFLAFPGQQFQMFKKDAKYEKHNPMYNIAFEEVTWSSYLIFQLEEIQLITLLYCPLIIWDNSKISLLLPLDGPHPIHGRYDICQSHKDFH